MQRRTLIKLASALIADLSLSASVSMDAQVQAEEPAADARNESTAIYPNFDLRFIPFTYAGSYHVLSHAQEDPAGRIRIQTLRRRAIPYRYVAVPFPIAISPGLGLMS